jgi:cyclophilin family peptidyl-prolyl cis-trans isomerase
MTPRTFHFASLAAVLATVASLGACGGGGGGGSASNTAPTVSSASAGTPVVGETLVFSFKGSNLDQPLTATSAGCSSVTLSTTAPNVSNASTAYFNCVVSQLGAQTLTVTRNSDGVQVFSIAYTVSPQAKVSSASAATPAFGQPLLITVNGTDLDRGLTATSPGCKTVSLSTTAPNISSASKAYFFCDLLGSGPQTLTVTRAVDSVVLTTVAFTIPTAPLLPSVTSASAATPKYSQSLLFTVNGSNLDQGISANSTACKNAALSTTAPNISGASKAYFSCVVSGVGDQTLNITRVSDGGALSTVAYTVPQPQVTMAISNGAAVSGNVVLSLDAAKAPITVNNFLAYVNAGFYDGTVFHRSSANFVLQGGGYAGPLVANSTPLPTLKTTSPTIKLEDNVGLSNIKLTVAMARTNAPDSATSQFFINLVDNLFLDATATSRGYAVFGSVTTGSDVVTAMAAAPCTAWSALLPGNDCLPSPNLTVTSAVQTR